MQTPISELENRIILDENRRFLDQQNGPFFISYLTNITHHDYHAPNLDQHPDFAVQAGIDLPWYQNDFRRYLKAVNYSDDLVKALIQQYKDSGHFENTIFIITSDHGEAFYEHPFKKYHNNVLNTEVSNVPLIIYAPKYVKPKTPSALASTIDIMPTVLNLLGSETVKFTGADLLSEDKKTAKYFAACWYISYCASVTNSEFRYIYNFGERSDELYAVQVDPQESHNLINDPIYFEVAERLKNDVSHWYFAYRNEFREHYDALGINYLYEIQSTKSKGFKHLLRNYNNKRKQ